MHFHRTAPEKGLFLIYDYDDGFDYMVLFLSGLASPFRR
jgi:hypothetical protein